MRTTHRTMYTLALATAAAIWLTAAPADAQRARPRGGNSSGGSSSQGAGSAQSGGDRQRGRRAPSDGGATTDSGSGAQDAGRSQPRDGGTSREPQRTDSTQDRERRDRPVIGRAVPREGPPPPPRGDRDRDRRGDRVYGYPWGYGGIGFYGGSYGRYYDPWWWDDPWWYGPSYPRYSARYGDGAIRVDVTPRDAAVFVDGYYAGIVDDFDGFFQRLHVDSGGHRLEIRLEGYETLSVDLHVQPNRTITYHGEMKPN